MHIHIHANAKSCAYTNTYKYLYTQLLHVLFVCVYVCVFMYSTCTHIPIGVYVVVNWSVRSMTAISGSFTTLMRMIAALKRLFHTVTKLINTGLHLNTRRSSSSAPLLPHSFPLTLSTVSCSFCLLPTLSPSSISFSFCFFSSSTVSCSLTLSVLFPAWSSTLSLHFLLRGSLSLLFNLLIEMLLPPYFFPHLVALSYSLPLVSFCDLCFSLFLLYLIRDLY